MQARYPTLDLELIAKAPVDLKQYYPLVRRPAAIVVDMLERGTEEICRLELNEEQEDQIDVRQCEMYRVIVQTM